MTRKQIHDTSTPLIIKPDQDISYAGINVSAKMTQTAT